METKYDILIIGSEISGLVSAALLAKKGFSVAVVSGREGSPVYEKDGYTLNERPSFITGLKGGPLGTLFDEIGVPKDTGIKGASPYQVVLPDERVDVYEEPELFHEELRRCFPKEIDKVSDFYNHLSGLNEEIGHVMDLNPFSFRILLPSGIRKGKRPLRDMAEGLGLSQRFQSFVRAQISSFSYLDGPTSIMAASSILESSRKGIYSIEGGLDGLKEMLLKKIESFGGDFIMSPAKEVSRNGNRWLLRTEEEALSGRVVIGNIDAQIFCGLFLDLRKKYLKSIDRIENSLSPLTVNLGVKESGVPVGMAANVIVLRDYGGKHILDNLILVHMGAPSNGKRGVSITCRVPTEEYRNGNIRGISEAMLEGVDELLPFIDRHIEVLDIRNVEPKGDGIFVTSVKQKMGIGGLPFEMVRGEIYYAGPEVYPSLGFDGLVYSGKAVAAAALRALTANKA
ncbi:MAG: hypothetical protein Q7T53_08190 [Deltaproteobacteria bacterium]|nr:hypothetical protein [Deltaproteobacteria bacterium]